MSIRRPAIDDPAWLFQDFLEERDGVTQHRALRVKYDGEVFDRVSETFDYSNPPYPDAQQRGGDIVAEIFYTRVDKLITIDDWYVNWQDDWPLRLAAEYLTRCMYRLSLGYIVRVSKGNYAFWVSEYFRPTDKSPNSYLLW